jgi:hypothetical protein
MEKRLVLAIALSLLVVLTWSAITSKPDRIDNKGVTQEVAPPLISAPKQTISSSALFSLAQATREIIFIAEQAAVKEVVFKQYQGYKFPLQYGFLLGAGDLIFQRQGAS